MMIVVIFDGIAIVAIMGYLVVAVIWGEVLPCDYEEVTNVV